MGYVIRSGAVHSSDCRRDILTHDSPIYLRHSWLEVLIEMVVGYAGKKYSL